MTLAGLERNTKTAFAVYETRYVRVEVHSENQGRRLMGSISIPSEDPQSSSRYGDSNANSNLTLGITRDAPAYIASVGLHRFEPVNRAVSPPLRAMLLTRQGISLP